MIGGTRFFRVVVVANGIEVSAGTESAARRTATSMAPEVFRSWTWRIIEVGEESTARQERFEVDWKSAGTVRRRVWKFDLTITAVVAAFSADGARWEVVNLLGNEGLDVPPHEPLLLSNAHREYRIRLTVVPTRVGPRPAWLAECRRPGEPHFALVNSPPRKISQRAEEWFDSEMVRLGLRSRPEAEEE